jgi:Fe-S cluster assembly ATP-binding protein
MLKIENLHASVEGTPILKGLDLEIGSGEIHAIMGPNGSGKSTLAAVLTGREEYEVTDGRVQFMGKDLLDLEPDERAQLGLFLGFQYPVEIPGVSNMYFMKASVNAVRRGRGEKELDALDFIKRVKEKVKEMEMRDEFLHRSVNAGFSGGEKKRNEILQMLMLEPRLAILDEIDSGLDIDALKVVAQGVNAQKSEDRSVLLVTHYQRLLEYIVPDFIHVMADGKIIKSGDKSLALELEEKGYSWINQDAA